MGWADTLKKSCCLGVGVSMKPDNSYVELIKKMAVTRNWSSSPRRITFTGLTTISWVLGKDLLNTQQKIIQSIGRIGRGNIQQTYTIRFAMRI
jgi:hypothetical protein